MLMLKEYIFVYGTLRKNSGCKMHNILAKHCRYLSEGYIQGRLYEVNGYPGAVQSGRQTERVSGEIYRINAVEIVLAKLDHYEECTVDFPHPHEYTREKLPVFLPQGRTVSAWVYLFNHDTTALEQIRCGDYLRFLQNGRDK